MTNKPTNTYRSGETLIELKPIDGLVALRFREPTAFKRRAVLQEGEELQFLSNIGVHIVETPEAATALDRNEDVEFASPIFRLADDDESQNDGPVVFTTRRVVAQFSEDFSPEQVAAIAEARRARVVCESVLPNSYVIEAASTTGVHGAFALAMALVDEGLAIRASPDIVHEVVSRQVTEVAERSVLDDWHLGSANLADAWSITKGAGVTIAVIDDGLDTSHPELVGRVVDEYDFENDVANASPKRPGDDHGTACTGVAAASGVQMSGAAPESDIVAVRTPRGLGTVEELTMWAWVGERADVVSCSWGPSQPFFPPDMTVEALRMLAEEARGRGVPIFFAAGNEAEDMTTDGYASSPHVMAVAASDDSDSVAWYSDYGPGIDICAPSDGGRKSISTTDRTGAAGYSEGDYTTTFGGTSSAAPLAAGVAALVRAANPSLSSAEVKQVLKDTATKIGGSDNYINGHSLDFGYGKVNAAKAVEAAVAAGGGGSGAVGGSSSGQGDPVATPTVSAPSEVDRDGGPPTFHVSLGRNSYFSIEVATDAHLFNNSSHGSNRDSNNFTSSFREAGRVLSGSSWTMSQDSWQLLRSNSQLYYRMLSSERSDGTGNFHVTTGDSDAGSAPSISISTGPSSPPSGSQNAGEVVFPSGARFDVVTNPVDNIDYDDPVTGGTVRLIEIQGRTSERLSANFTVREFVTGLNPTPRYARISPDLVRALQQLRDAARSAVTVRSAYRHFTHNEAVDGAPQSQHMVGRAADIRISGMTPLDMADLALTELGPAIGIGLGRTGIHIDLRGVRRTWTYEGAELGEQEFDSWAASHASNRSLQSRARLESVERGNPLIEGPGVWRRGDAIPTFRIKPGCCRFVAFEVAIDPALFELNSEAQTEDNFYGSWSEGLVDASGHGSLSLQPNDRAWDRLTSNAEVVVYRAIATDDPETWAGLRTSLDNSAKLDAPATDILTRTERNPSQHHFLGGVPKPAVPQARDRSRLRSRRQSR